VLTSALSFDLDQRLTGEHVMLALRKTEGILAMFTKVPVEDNRTINKQTKWISQFAGEAG
jgi:hypothetical protein